MAEFKEVDITIGFTQALGNYEFLREDVRIAATLEPGETIDDAYAEVREKVEDKLVESAKSIHSQLSKDAKRKTKIDPE